MTEVVRSGNGNMSALAHTEMRDLYETFDIYDTLEPPLRQLLQLAPFDCDPRELVEMRQYHALPDLVRATIGAFTQAVREEALAWGPGYPLTRRFTPPMAREGAASSRTRYRRARLVL